LTLATSLLALLLAGPVAGEVTILERLESVPDGLPFDERLEHMYSDLPSRRIEPAGWIREFLDRQLTGLTGHPEQSGFPFNTGMWTDEMDVRNREYSADGSDWWPYEQTAYYLDGALRVAYLTDDGKLLRKVRGNIASVIARQRNDGSLVPAMLGVDTPIMPIFLRMVLEEYENTRKPKLLAAMERHYRAFYGSDESFGRLPDTTFADRTVLSVEVLCRLAAETGNSEYARIAEKLYLTFCGEHPDDSKSLGMLRSQLDRKQPAHGHAVVYHEFLKLPAILYLFTGKPVYRDAVAHAIAALHRDHVLADGLSSGVESLSGNASWQAHELCNVPENIWAYGWALKALGTPAYADNMEKVLFNAGIGAITKDFRAHQYYSSPNQPVATIGSNPFQDEEGWGYQALARLCYRPGHGTECCSGAVHKMMPLYLKRMWLQRGDEIVAALHGPCSAQFDSVRGRTVTVTAETAYPFENRIRYSFRTSGDPEDFAFTMRVPEWATGCTLRLNGAVLHRGRHSGCFLRVRRIFHTDDVLELAFDTAPVVRLHGDPGPAGKGRARGMSVHYGPLLFSLPVEAKRMLVTDDAGVGKCSPEFPMHCLEPRSPWNFALPENLKGDAIRVERKEPGGYPWDVGNHPLALRVTGARLVRNWRLAQHIRLPDIPYKLELEDRDRQIVLVPMGSTLLRMSVFAVETGK